MNDVTSIANPTELKSYISRIENLEAEKSSFQEDIKEVYQEAKASGFDTKIIRQVVKLRRLERAEREELETLVQLYLSAAEG